jgi:hypothetical protein
MSGKDWSVGILPAAMDRVESKNTRTHRCRRLGGAGMMPALQSANQFFDPV